MVSFSCEICGDVLTKKKLDPHRNRCRDATFTCIDCMVHFTGVRYRAHTSCITEDQKYQGALYKSKRQKPNEPELVNKSGDMAHRAYVEDVTEEYEAYRDYEIRDSDDDDTKSTADLPPEAPTPPPAVEDNVNVFDFLVAATPNASNINLQAHHPNIIGMGGGMGGGRQLVRFEDDGDNLLDHSGYMADENELIQYGTGAVRCLEYATPAPKAHRKKVKDGDREAKKDKKRKRLRIETSPAALAPGPGPGPGPGDEVMPDAPPVLHSGLTGGLGRMMHPPQFPPSPDYSGGDGAEHSPASPIKKTKHVKPVKASRSESFGNNLKALMAGSSKSKVSKKRKHSSERKEKEKKQRRHHHRSGSKKAPKLIEYKAKTGGEKETESGTLIVYKPRSDLFLSLCNKGPESDRGCSLNKALKRFHRERTSSGTSLGKVMEEKELFRSLRMRRNERGEIVLFTLDDEE